MGVPVRLGCGLAFSVKRETIRSTSSVRPKRPRTPQRMKLASLGFSAPAVWSAVWSSGSSEAEQVERRPQSLESVPHSQYFRGNDGGGGEDTFQLGGGAGGGGDGDGGGGEDSSHRGGDGGVECT